MKAYLYCNISRPIKNQKLNTKQYSFSIQNQEMLMTAGFTSLMVQGTYVEEDEKLYNGLPYQFRKFLTQMRNEPAPVVLIVYNVEAMHINSEVRERMINAIHRLSGCLVLESNPVNDKGAIILFEKEIYFPNKYFARPSVASAFINIGKEVI